MIRCRVKIPTSNRSSVLLESTRRKRTPTGKASPCNAFGAGTTMATIRAKPPITEVIQNRPERPSQLASSGPRISASTKEPPTDMPISAMARVRCFSLTTSPISAMITLAMAPAPCRARPAMTPWMWSLMAATTPPATNSSRPISNRGRRPKRSESMPKGICKRACIRP